MTEQEKSTLGPRGRDDEREALLRRLRELEPQEPVRMEALPVAKSIDQEIEEQRQALQRLYDSKVEQERMRLQALEASKTPEQKRIDNLERIIEHMDAQIVKAGGHSYKLYL